MIVLCVGGPVVECEQARVQGCAAPPVRLALPGGLPAVPARAFPRQCGVGARDRLPTFPGCGARHDFAQGCVAVFSHRRLPLCSGVPADQLRPAAVLPVEEDRRPCEPEPGAEHLSVPVLLQPRAATRRLALQPAGSPSSLPPFFPTLTVSNVGAWQLCAEG